MPLQLRYISMVCWSQSSTKKKRKKKKTSNINKMVRFMRERKFNKILTTYYLWCGGLRPTTMVRFILNLGPWAHDDQELFPTLNYLHDCTWDF